MASAISNTFRLARAGIVLAQHGVHLLPKGMPAPLPLRLARWLSLPFALIGWPFHIGKPKETRIARAFTSLGPSYIKLGQFLATRGDLIGPELQRDLSHLQDRLPPFSMAEARRATEDAFGGRLEDHFAEFGPPVAAASIAQVHKAAVIDKSTGARRFVAVKILRPGVERRFQRDIDSYRFAARLIERVSPPVRRLQPVAVVDNLEQTTTLEMDLRLEAAAISEFADNIAADFDLPDGRCRVPTLDSRRPSQRVLTVEWIDGTPIGDISRLKAEGHDLERLGLTVLRTFLRHAMRDGLFHADMHQGNMLVEPDGTIAAVDFGIVGRLGAMEKRFLAEILYGLITRDYRRAAQVHFDAGYVPTHHSVEVFAQAMRAIGEPIHGRTADEISMADLLGQLFAYTDVFDMKTRPELILLQKSMVIVEGVARGLDPRLNLWTAAEPVAKAWLDANFGLEGRLREAGEGAEIMGRVLTQVPRFLEQVETTTSELSRMSREGWRLDLSTIEAMARASARHQRWQTAALWLGALALATLAVVAATG